MLLPTTLSSVFLALPALTVPQEPHEDGACPTARVYQGEFDCMRVPVFENRALGEGREISLHVVILPALGDEAAADPVFVLMGGPGQSAADKAGYFADYLAKVRQERDLVLVDMRGTGDSHPLDFEIGPEDIVSAISDPLPRPIVERELAKLSEQADLTQYTTDNIVDDLDDVREALGYDQINLWGASYGTRAALVYLRRHEEHVRTAVIKAVAPMGFAVGANFAPDAQSSLDRMFSDCAADPSCSSAYGDLEEQFDMLLDGLGEEPAIVEARHPLDNSTVEVPLTAAAIALAVHTMLYSTPDHAALPGMIFRGAQGNLEEWAARVLLTRVLQFAQIYEGMFLSVLSAEDEPLLDQGTLIESARDTFLGTGFSSFLTTALLGWPGAELDESFWEPVRSEVPVLVISGELDPVTPAYLGAEAARHLPNSKHLVFDIGSHDDSAFRPCLDGIYEAFYRTGTIEGLDTSCSTTTRSIPFTVR